MRDWIRLDWIRSDGGMARCSAVMKALIFLTFSLHLSSAVTHSLQYIYTGVTPGINFPEFTEVGQVDGQQFDYYDSKIRKMIPKMEWIQKINADDPDYWNRETQNLQGWQETFKVGVDTLMQRFNQTAGVHTVQYMYGCERDDDGTTRGYRQWGYDGEDFLVYDLKTLTWIAPTPQALITKQKWEPDAGYMSYLKNYLEKECIEWLQKHVGYGRETLERKVPPTASVFQKHSPPELVCHATGFFPKTVMITWQKNGEDVHEDVELRETLPNQDGSFQKRSVLTVSAEDLQKHTYTCVIQHSSLEKEIVLREEDIRILNPGGGSDVVLIGIIVGVAAALLVLVAVVAGIVVWKNNSGERRKDTANTHTHNHTYTHTLYSSV
ncbi:major histocompatibility complex class I-related gene protein isoform X1 [Ictalurus punctatus]|uniref:Major histocompatibility complex class I-related gene protein isoform X1 n=1 Tax=Ictalurus punctatus TaxID=7998 RepID=A0A9F7TEY2_ICTPU|nr:major histocompatibility complex class I-related gene protein isoform X1 [Ictalurus punctatus]